MPRFGCEGEFDLLVNNARHDVGGKCRLDKGSIDDCAAKVQTNLIGMMRVSHGLLTGMAERIVGHPLPGKLKHTSLR